MSQEIKNFVEEIGYENASLLIHTIFYKNVMIELIDIYFNFKYKNILYDIDSVFSRRPYNESSNTEYVYNIENFRFENNLILDLDITKIINLSGVLVENIFSIEFYVKNHDICDNEYKKILLDKKFYFSPNLPQVIVIKHILEFIDEINENFEYDLYSDLILFKDNKSMFLKELDVFRRNIPDNCGICFETISNDLKTTCCNQSICRLCINKIIKKPVKCPYCRKEFY